MALFYYILIVLCVSSASTNDSSLQPYVNSLIARFQSNGIRGYVLFTQNGTATSISTKIFDNGPNNETYSWKVYNAGYMIDNNECTVRNNIYLSFDLTLLMGPLEPIRQNLFNVHLNFITGEHSFFGKTLALRGTVSGRMSCAIVLPFENKSMFSTYFQKNIQGIVYFLQSGNLFSIVSSLNHNSSSKKTSLHDWSIIQVNPKNKDPKVIYSYYFQNEINGCNSIDRKAIISNSETNQISISSEPSTLNSRSYVNLQDVPQLSTKQHSFFVIYDKNNQVLTCAPIVPIQSKKIVAKINEKNLNALVMFSQESPIDPTLVDIELKVNHHAFSYGIDELPSISRTTDIKKKCPNIKNIIYNPVNISPFSVPVEGIGTSDQYAIGDLSGKYGHLLQKPNEKISTVDFNLPLFGPRSVVGRALVFYAANGTTIACANLELIDTEMTVAFATFDKPVQGQVIFKQPINSCNDNTYIYFEISRSGENSTVTSNHDWKIQKNPIFTDNSWSTSDCSKTEDVFNPYNKSNDLIHSRECKTGFSIDGCRLGEMSKKHSTIEIVPYKVNDNGDINLKKYYFIDTHLPLCGSNSIIGKSIYINKSNFSKESLSCTNIVLFESDDQE